MKRLMLILLTLCLLLSMVGCKPDNNDEVDPLPEPKEFTIGDSTERLSYYEKVSEKQYEAYVSTLVEEGATTVNTYTMGSNKYTLLKNKKGHVYVGYAANAKIMRVIYDKLYDVFPAPAAPETKAVCSPSLWQLEINCKERGEDGGMSYVIQLTDGTFVVIDGGYDVDAVRLLDHLKANTIGGGTPVVSAWIITHLHNDHYGALKEISQKYQEQLDVKAFYYNFPGVQCEDIAVTNANDIEDCMRKWSNATLYSKLHTGMNFSVVDAKFTVVCTYEDVFHTTISNGNDTSTVLKAEVGGQSILFLGDAYYKQSTIMVNHVDEEVLKSDIVQISHHGYEGCGQELYAKVKASVALWPMPIVGRKNNALFKEWYEKDINLYIKESTDIKKIIVSGAGTTKLELPYTPQGERILDYNAFYNANKNK